MRDDRFVQQRRHNQRRPEPLCQPTTQVVHKAMVKPVQIFLVFIAQFELRGREVMVQRRGTPLFATVALCVPVSSSTPDAIALTCATCGETSLAYWLELVAFDFPGSETRSDLSHDLQRPYTCRYHTLSVLFCDLSYSSRR